MVKSGIPAEEAVPPPGESRYRWVMLALLWLCYFIFGCVGYSIAPLVTPIIEDLGISYSQMGVIMGAWPLTYVLVATVAGAILDRWSIRRSIFLGLVIIGLSRVLRCFANGFGTLFLCVALFGLGGPMISIGCPKTISVWFTGRARGTAVGIYLTGVWIGMGVVISSMNGIVMPLAGYNWRMAFAGFGSLAVAVALLWWFLARDVRPSDAAENPRIDRVFRSLISARNVRLVIVMGFLSLAIGHGVNDWLPKILEVGGLSQAAAGVAASVPIWVGIPTIIIVPRVVAPHLRGKIIALLSLVLVVALMMVTVAKGGYLMVSLVVYGLSYCCVMPLLVLALMDLPEVGSRYMGSASGLFFCIGELGGFVGPLMVGAIKDLAGGFLAGAGLLAGLSLVRAVIALMVKVKPARDGMPGPGQ